MKNKKLFEYDLYKFSAAEHRLISGLTPTAQDAEGGKPIEAEAPKIAETTTKDKALSFTQKLYELPDLEAARKNYEGNPFRDNIDSMAISPSRGPATRELIRGSVYLEYGKNKQERREKNPLGTEIDYEFLAIEWPNIRAKLDKLFEGKSVSRELIELTLEKKHPAFMELVLALADKEAGFVLLDLAPEDPIVKKALDSLELERPELNKPGVRNRILMKGVVAREEMKPIILPMEPIMTSANFAMALAKGDRERGVDKIASSIGREGGKINARLWRTQTKEDLVKIMADFRKVGINTTDEFYTTMFANLYWGIDESRNEDLKKEGVRVMFQNPENNYEALEALSDKAKDFVRAHKHLMYVKNMLIAQALDQVGTLTRGRDLDSDALFTKTTDVLKKNYNKFMKALKERDYATAGMYVVGIWAIYTSLDGLGLFKKGGSGTKYLAYGLAAYCGLAFAKNAGYDVLKLAGVKDVDYEIQGTPLGVLKNILEGVPEFNEIREDPEFFDVTLRMSEVSLADLDKLYKESNSKGIHFIHPKEFSKIFKEECKVGPFKIGIGENGLEDYSGMSNTKLSRAQQLYLDKGRQIYNLAWAMQTVYERTLMQDDPNYRGKSYEEGILNDPNRKYAKVRHLLGAVGDYTDTGRHELWKSSVTVDEAHTHLDKAFAEAKIGFSIESQLDNPYHFSGYVQKYPVVFVRMGDVYRVYLREKYGDAKQPGTDWIRGAEIPVEGKAQAVAAKEIHNHVAARLGELLRPLRKQDATTGEYSDIEYDGENWTCSISYPEVEGLKLKAETETATIVPFHNGKGITISSVSGFRLSLDDAAAKQRPMETAIIRKLLLQTNMKGFHAFANVGALNIHDIDATKGTFSISIGDSKLKTAMKLAGEDYAFAEPGGEQKLVSSSFFAAEYIKAIGGDEIGEFNKTVASLKETIKHGVDESHIKFFFKALFAQINRGPLSGANTDIFSGSKPELFTNMVIDATKEEAMQRLRASLKGVTSMAEVEQMRQTYLQDVNDKLQAQISQIGARSRSLQAAGKDWSREDFNAFVVEPIRAASSTSTAYREERTKFEAELYGLSYKGLANMSDFNNTAHAAVGKLLGVYAYYTARLDTAELDSITWPASADQEGHFVLNYLDYVKTRILSEVPIMASGGGISVATIDDASSPRWRIEDYDSWKKHGAYHALDPLDNLDPFDHDMSKHTEHQPGKSATVTELDKELKKRLLEAKQYLIRNFEIDEDKLNDYFDRDPADCDNVSEWGLLQISQDPDSRNPVKGSGRNKKYKLWSRMWVISDRIDAASGGRRSTQEELIQKEVRRVMDEILASNNYMIDEPGVIEKVENWFRIWWHTR